MAVVTSSALCDFRKISKVFSLKQFQQLRTLNSFKFQSNLDINVKNEIENKWATTINKGTFQVDKNNIFYVLSMFPYPSGNLHLGHVRVYTISDVLARYHRLNGKNVLHPMGFDSFGLPAENAALHHNVDPKTWTYNNISSMKKQLMSLGLSFDWDHEVITCNEEYYKFTQYIFLLLYDAGLVYQKEALVNWDPVDKTVLADEQVDSSGKSWRSGATVEKKLLKQWYIKTTRYALSLLEGLDDPLLEDWKDIIDLQKHWLGSCDGARFEFDLINGEDKGTMTIWMKYPEHINDSSYIVASPKSILGIKYGKKNVKLQARNPFNDAVLPIYISDDVEFDDGCDIKLGIPTFYENDREFAKNNSIEYKKKELYFDYERRLQICNLAIDRGLGGYFVSSKLRDWLISRQRHWGTPIPIVHCKECGVVPVKYKDLPVKISSIRDTTCPKCNRPAVLDSDTMDTFVDSSWYFLRYIDPHNRLEPFDTIKANQIMPVDVYIGGKEHAVLHLYYARFIAHFLNSINLLNKKEPFKRLLVQGMVMGKTFQVEETGKYLCKDEVVKEGNYLFEKSSRMKVVESWDKMSKSKFNGIEPETILEEHGIDTTRLLILAEVSPTSHRYWDSDKFSGILNWQNRLWSLMGDFLNIRNSAENVNAKQPKDKKLVDLWDGRNFYIKGITFNYETTHQLSIVISKLQGFTNTLKKCDNYTMLKDAMFEKCLAELIIMLYPMAPHFSSELWSGLVSAANRVDVEGNHIKWNEPVSKQNWPKLDDDYELQLTCKVNNAVKENIKIPYIDLRQTTPRDALKLALGQAKVSSFIKGCDILDYKYSYTEGYNAIINIVIDPWQKNKKISN